MNNVEPTRAAKAFTSVSCFEPYLHLESRRFCCSTRPREFLASTYPRPPVCWREFHGLREKVVEYVWGSPLHNQPGLCGGNFDIIICSDLLYDPAGWDLLKKSLRRLIKSGRDEVKESCAEEGKPGTGDRNEGGVIYLAHRIRNPQERDFFTSLKARDEDGTTFTCRMLFSGGERTRPPVEMGTVGGASRHDKNLRVDGSDREEDAVSWVGIGDFPDITLYELSLVRPVGGGSARVCTDEATA